MRLMPSARENLAHLMFDDSLPVLSVPAVALTRSEE